MKDALATVRYDQDPKAAGRVALAKATKQGETSLASIKADISHIRKGFAAANAINSKALKELREAQVYIHFLLVKIPPVFEEQAICLVKHACFLNQLCHVECVKRVECRARVC